MSTTWLHEPRDTFTTEQVSLAGTDRCSVSKSDGLFVVNEAIPGWSPSGHHLAPTPSPPQRSLDAAETSWESEQNKERGNV